MQELCGELGMEKPITKFKLHNICKPEAPHSEYPCLKFIKAAEGRHMVKCVTALARERNSGSQVHIHRYIVMRALDRMYRCMDTDGFQLDDHPAFKKRVNEFMCHYSALARIAVNDGRMLWSIVPKFHFTFEVAEQARWESPRLFWCYSGETHVGYISRLGHTCLKGHPVYSVPAKLMQKYRIGLHLRLRRDFGEA